ncbi:MAG: FAD-dependent oxidoreductase [Spirochaetes bacterium]|nr:FAD-dependent oxidoreductase [Spirochaetota bacterium]
MKVIIIGGSVAGITTAARLRRLNESLEIVIIERSKELFMNKPALCYYLSNMNKKIESYSFGLEEKLTSVYNMRILANHEAVAINKDTKNLSVKNLNTKAVVEMEYDKLIFATGFSFYPHKIFRNQAVNFFPLNNLDDAVKIKEYIKLSSAKKLLIVGLNCYSLKMADCFLRNGYEVSVLSETEFCISDFDNDFSLRIIEDLSKQGVRFYLKSPVKKIRINDAKSIYEVITDKEGITTQFIVYMDNIKVNSKLASKSQIKINDLEQIEINQQFETTSTDIFSVGGAANELAEIPHFAYTQLRARELADSILFQKESKADTNNPKILNLKNAILGKVGFSESVLKSNKIAYQKMYYNSGSKERYINGSKPIFLKVLYNQEKKILGIQIFSEDHSIIRLLDSISVFIKAGLPIDELKNLHFAYSPELSSRHHPLNTIGNIFENHESDLSLSFQSAEVFNDKQKIILDIRSTSEYQKKHLENALFIPLEELRERLNEVPVNREIYLLSHTGLRSYLAERILKGHGYEHVYNIQGGLSIIDFLSNGYLN